ncbi:MAG TPA: AAA family ATPase [Burkholderiales bacterium]|jgi:type II secretory pathway predicted ATPase ExeA|nr:AAA family ATPase [Burkholderiales bacterium]
MYYAFFGLNQPPFKITPDTEAFFEGGNRGAILEALIYAITHGEGIIKVTGEVGSGKTMLCRVLQTRLPQNVENVYLANPSVSPEEILHAIAFELQITLPRDASRLEVMHALNAYLLERHAQKKQVVVFVEESQGMPLATLEEIRLLSNLETQQHKLLQIVLFGQPELDENLRQPQIRQLRERITHSFNLAPLDEQDVRAYLAFRLRAAGYHGPDLFGPRVISYMTRASGGLSRRINLIADKALLAAFAEGTHNVSLAHVKAAVRDSEFSDVPMQKSRSPMAYALVGLAIGGALGIAAFAAYLGFSGNRQAAPSASESAAPAQAPLPAASTPVRPAVASGPPVVQAAAPAPAGPAVAALELPPDLLEQRLLATTQWLDQQNAGAYSIQLLGSPDAELLREYFKTIAKYLEIEKVYVYRTVANQRPSFTVLYGTYADRYEVTRVLESLPPEMRVNRPYTRTIQGIRAEIAYQNRS